MGDALPMLLGGRINYDQFLSDLFEYLEEWRAVIELSLLILAFLAAGGNVLREGSNQSEI